MINKMLINMLERINNIHAKFGQYLENKKTEIFRLEKKTKKVEKRIANTLKSTMINHKVVEVVGVDIQIVF